ncbi:MAG: MFS transporter [Clostridia bacterium]|nr:MFS transporter [Clostridia bacterium]
MEADIKKRSTLLIILCWAAYATQYINKYSIQICLKGMIESGLFTESFGGNVLTAFFASYAFGQFVNGWLGDKVNPRYMIGTGLAGAAAMNLMMGLAGDKIVVLIIWCLNGWFCSMLWAPVVRCVAEFIPVERRSGAGASLSATSPVGLLTVYALGGIFLDEIGSYRHVYIAASCFAAVMAIVWFIGTHRLRDHFKHYSSVAPENGKNGGGARVGGKKLAFLLISSGAAFGFGCIMFNGVLKDGVSSWTHSYLVSNYGITESLASTLLMILPFVNLAGAFSAVKLFKKNKNEFLTTAAMFTVSVVSISLLLAVRNFSAVFGVILLALSSAAMLGANTMLLTFLPMRFAHVGRAATFTGMLDTVSYLSSAVSGTVNGNIIENSGWNTLILVWVGLALAGVTVSVLGTLKWRKRKESPEAEQTE